MAGRLRAMRLLAANADDKEMGAVYKKSECPGCRRRRRGDAVRWPCCSFAPLLIRLLNLVESSVGLLPHECACPPHLRP